MLINIALLVLGTTGAFAAIGGETWIKDFTIAWYRRITWPRGWIAIACLTASLLLGIGKEVESRRSAAKSDEKIDELRRSLEEARTQLSSSDAESSKKIAALQQSLGEARDQLSKSAAESKTKMAVLQDTLDNNHIIVTSKPLSLPYTFELVLNPGVSVDFRLYGFSKCNVTAYYDGWWHEDGMGKRTEKAQVVKFDQQNKISYGIAWKDPEFQKFVPTQRIREVHLKVHFKVDELIWGMGCEGLRSVRYYREDTGATVSLE